MKPKSGVSSKGFFLIVIYWVLIALAKALKGIFGSISFCVVFVQKPLGYWKSSYEELKNIPLIVVSYYWDS